MEDTIRGPVAGTSSEDAHGFGSIDPPFVLNVPQNNSIIPTRTFLIPPYDTSRCTHSELFVDNAGGEEREECCICLEPMGAPQALRVFPCLHKLHAQCAVEWLHTANMQRGCPQCRRPANLSQTILVTTPVESIGIVMSRHLETSDAVDIQAPASPEVAHLMEICCCSQAVAEESLRGATAGLRNAESAAVIAKQIIYDRLNGHGTELLVALNQNDLIVADRLLLARDVALGVRDEKFGKTALIIAAQKRLRPVVQRMCELIVAGIAGPESSMDAQDKEGYTALMWASLRGHSEICSLLLAYDAKTNVVNSSGLTALELATHCGVTELFSPQASRPNQHRGRRQTV